MAQVPIGGALITAFPAVIATPVASRLPPREHTSENTLAMLVLGIVISVFIFVAIISIYDLIKEHLVVSYTRKITQDPNVVVDEREAAKMNIEAEAGYAVVATFSFIAIILAVLVLPILFYAYHSICCQHV